MTISTFSRPWPRTQADRETYQRLRATLEQPGLSRLLRRLERRLDDGRPLTGTILLTQPTERERAAVDALFGRRPSQGVALAALLDRLAAILRHAGLASDLKEAVETLLGPIVDRSVLRREQEESWHAVRGTAAPEPRLARFLDQPRAFGLLRRLAQGDPAVAQQLVTRALAVLARLPAQGVPLPALAVAATGDSHALDGGQPLATLILHVMAPVSGIFGWHSAAERRLAWAAVGVLCDELSAPLLVLNLPAAGEDLGARALRLHATGGEPYRLTARLLLRHAMVFSRQVTGARIYVCENPTVVAAAANQLGAQSAPLISLEGQPATTAHLLLDRLTQAGIELRYHGDFDWSGLAIANLVMHRHGALPWRFKVADYQAAPGGTALTGTPVVAAWDPELEPALRAAGRAVHEEQVLDLLLADLAGGLRGGVAPG